MKIFTQSLVIILSTFMTFAIVNTSLVSFMSQFLAGVVFLWLVLMIIRKLRKEQELFKGSSFDIFLVILGILLTVFITGGLSSQIFFLLYFLLFAITFMFEPVTIFIYVGCLIFLFGEQALKANLFPNILTLGSLLVLSPLAFLFGNEFKKREKAADKIMDSSENIISDAENLLSKKPDLPKSTRDEIKEIEDHAEDIKKSIED